MENRAHALIVGLFIALLGLGVVGGIWWFSGSGEDFNYYELVSSRPVTGLNPQAAVRFRGVRVGRVLDISLDDDGSRNVVVTVRVRSDVPITLGTRATLGTQGLTGLAFVQLDDDGKDPRPLVKHGLSVPQIPLTPGLVENATEAGREIIGRLRSASEKVDQLMSKDNVERLDTILRNLAASSEHLEKTLANANVLVGDMRRFTSQDNATQLHDAIRDFSQAAKQLQPLLEEGHRVVARYDKLGAKLDDAVSADTLPQINQLAGELQATTQQLNQLLGELDRSPQMLLFGREQLRPGPGESMPQESQ